MGRMLRRTILVASVIAVAALAWWAMPAKEPERTGLLAPFDLASGRYVIVFGTGEPELRSTYPDNPLVRVVDDQDVIAKHRNEIDVTSGLTDFLPSEGRPQDIFLYVYRDGERVGGSQVTQADRVRVPGPVVEASRVVPMRDLVDGAGEYPGLGDRLSPEYSTELR